MLPAGIIRRESLVQGWTGMQPDAPFRPVPHPTSRRPAGREHARGDLTPRPRLRLRRGSFSECWGRCGRVDPVCEPGFAIAAKPQHPGQSEPTTAMALGHLEPPLAHFRTHLDRNPRPLRPRRRLTQALASRNDPRTRPRRSPMLPASRSSRRRRGIRRALPANSDSSSTRISATIRTERSSTTAGYRRPPSMNRTFPRSVSLRTGRGGSGRHRRDPPSHTILLGAALLGRPTRREH
jgi:hypothetical protein